MADSARGASATTAIATMGRHMEALEARLTAMIAQQQVQHAASLREADRLADLAGKNTDARLDAVERRQLQLEHLMSGLTCTVTGRGEERQMRGCPAPAIEAGHASFERRLRALEEKCGDNSFGGAQGSPAPAVEQSLKERGGHHGTGGDNGDAALLAVQELESLLHTELRAIHKRCNTLQDSVDGNAIVPLRGLGQQFQEMEQTVQQLIGAGQECSSRVEEHKFRLEVIRTKIDVHDQKISRLETTRWTKGLGGSGGDGDRTPTSSTSGTSPNSRLNTLNMSIPGCARSCSSELRFSTADESY